MQIYNHRLKKKLFIYLKIINIEYIILIIMYFIWFHLNKVRNILNFKTLKV